MSIIDTDLRQCSPFYANYKRMHEVEQEEIERAKRENRPVKEVFMHFKRNPIHKEGTHGAPVAKEIAIIYTCDDTSLQTPQEVSIAVHPKRISLFKDKSFKWLCRSNGLSFTLSIGYIRVATKHST